MSKIIRTKDDADVYGSGGLAMKTIYRDAARYADQDDCLAACAREVSDEHGLEGWALDARWTDDDRAEIQLTVPDWVAS